MSAGTVIRDEVREVRGRIRVRSLWGIADKA